MTGFALEIRDATAARLAKLRRYFPRGRPHGEARVRKSFLLPTQDSDLPCALVYFAGETMSADGDANAGPPSFNHLVRIAVSSLIKADDEDSLDDALDAAAMEILDTLLSDPSWLKLFSGVESIERSYQLTGDTKFLMAEARTIFTLSFASDWLPRIDDLTDFAGVSLRLPDGVGIDIDPPQT